MLQKFLLVCALLLVLFSCNTKGQNKNLQHESIELIPKKSYFELKEETRAKRDEFKELYQCGSQLIKDSIVIEAQQYLLDVSDEYFKAWYNTPWTFHGTSQTPGEGSIACGYFITTTLKDMGFNIPRVKWAQQTSEYMIKKIALDIKRFHKAPMKDVMDYIASQGEGLYVVGLDTHVGYIYYHNQKMSFVHSNYYRRDIGVMSETLVGRNPLNDSKYRVIGKIFHEKMVLNWILNTSYSE